MIERSASPGEYCVPPLERTTCTISGCERPQHAGRLCANPEHGPSLVLLFEEMT